ncbi:MAG: hypothetical protein HKO92_04430 [Flavobacteriaceae bacterium]|nr:hypothetical protein [Flavobacteriaceae bacterium]
MNPSARGWIKKLLKSIDALDSTHKLSEEVLYLKLRQSGFIYGSNIYTIKSSLKNTDFTNEESCKINLFLALLNTYYNANSSERFIESVIGFYNTINVHKTSLFNDLLGGRNDVYTLEKIIHKRIQIDSNVLTKNFKYFITNALMYVDILAYFHYLNSPKTSEAYIKSLESTIETIVFNALNVKLKKSKYDNSLIRLLESSLRYQNHEHIPYQTIITHEHNKLESQYILDIACMATWSDQIIDAKEHLFLKQLTEDLNIPQQKLDESIESINQFYTSHKSSIALLSSKNVVESFYHNSSNMVKKLISRNSKRLLKELKESKELVKLISHSTVRDLTIEEQKKINAQLLDLFKSVPSFAIFMLPGGALLLPLFIKFIPKLLPSAFDDNRIEDEE